MYLQRSNIVPLDFHCWKLFRRNIERLGNTKELYHFHNLTLLGVLAPEVLLRDVKVVSKDWRLRSQKSED